MPEIESSKARIRAALRSRRALVSGLHDGGNTRTHKKQTMNNKVASVQTLI